MRVTLTNYPGVTQDITFTVVVDPCEVQSVTNTDLVNESYTVGDTKLSIQAYGLTQVPACGYTMTYQNRVTNAAGTTESEETPDWIELVGTDEANPAEDMFYDIFTTNNANSGVYYFRLVGILPNNTELYHDWRLDVEEQAI